MKTINGKNYFNQHSFNEVCETLEKGEAISVYIDVIGHTRNNYEQETYREELTEKYKDRLQIEKVNGAYSYHYEYVLRG